MCKYIITMCKYIIPLLLAISMSSCTSIKPSPKNTVKTTLSQDIIIDYIENNATNIYLFKSTSSNISATICWESTTNKLNAKIIGATKPIGDWTIGEDSIGPIVFSSHAFNIEDHKIEQIKTSNAQPNTLYQLIVSSDNIIGSQRYYVSLKNLKHTPKMYIYRRNKDIIIGGTTIPGRKYILYSTPNLKHTWTTLLAFMADSNMFEYTINTDNPTEFYRLEELKY